jgi:hypothetical protein
MEVMSDPKLRRRYDTVEDILDDDGELDPELERDEEWHEHFKIVEDEDEDGL